MGEVIRVVRRLVYPVLACAALLAAAILATAVAGGGPPPITAGAGPAPDPPSITAIGAAEVRVAPAAREDAAITRVVAEAHARAIPRAFAAARAEAERQAKAAGVRLGAVQQVAPLPVGAYNVWSGTPNTGVHGIGLWCRNVRSRRDGSRRRRCSRPHREGVVLGVTFDLVR
jgi:hypothetical protein